MSDQLVPNFLRVNADGTISAALSGNLQLPADRVNGFWVAQTQHAVYWVDASGRQVAACSGSSDASSRGAAQQAGYTPDGAGGAVILEQADSSGASYVRAEAWNATGDAIATVITSRGESSFLQLSPVALGPANAWVTWGVASTPGNGTVAATYTVTHGLGRRPLIVVGNMNNAGLLAGTLNYTTRTFDVGITYPRGYDLGVGWGPGAFTFAWLAIG